MAAALAEPWIDAARGCRTSIAITLGTGVGTGVILNAQPAQSAGFGSEWGHTIIDFKSVRPKTANSKPGTVEDYASGSGILRNAQAQGLSCHSSHEIFAILEAGTKRSPTSSIRIAQAMVDDFSHALAALLDNLSLGFAPDVITLSGGIMQTRLQTRLQTRPQTRPQTRLQTRRHFLSSALKLYRRELQRFSKHFRCPVEVSNLSNACLLGAGSLPWRS